MTSTQDGPARRLDSWNAIAAYLARDERTVRRWETDLGLPIRRAPDGGDASVFAYVSEIDAWLQAATPPGAMTVAAGEAGDPISQALAVAALSDVIIKARLIALPEPAAPPLPPGQAWPRVATIVVAVILLLGVNRWTERARTAGATRYEVTPAHVIAIDGGGSERWRHAFPAGEQSGISNETPWATAGRTPADLYALVTRRVRLADSAALGGRLLLFDPRGQVQRSWSLDDDLSFESGRYDAPWDLPSFRIDERGVGRRVAVAAHHDVWWPGVVTVLDEGWRRTGTFVNAGWIEHVQWASPTRLLVSGFSNARDGGMAALLDAGNLDGQSPEPAGSPYHCLTCGAGTPVRYVVFPRSELNRVTGSSFNRARLSMSGDRVLIRTEEVVSPDRASIVDAVYEFLPSLDLLQASYGDRYWELHRALEREGKIHHTREQCPDRDGPREILVWEPATGWRTVSAAR